MEKAIQAFLAEDIGTGDITTDSIVPDHRISEAIIVAKGGCVIAGHEPARRIFQFLDPHVWYEEGIKDGETARPGDTVSLIRGKTRAILTGERVALNLFQRLSGIATATREFVDTVEGTRATILDTRKTAPGLRVFEKYAVRVGGGQNHRFDLSEMALVKENHITAAGSITEAVARIRNRSNVTIEVEVKGMDELEEAVAEAVDMIMLDNWNIEETRKAVLYINRRIPLEASGNMTIDRVREVALTGVDFISVGALTHSFEAADLSLLIQAGKGQ